MQYPEKRDLLNVPARAARAASAGLALAFALLPAPAPARRARVPSTGLRSIVYARPAPDFAFDAGTGPTHLAALTGRPVVLSFWATWCEPCRAELPAFARLRATYGDSVAFLTISDEAPGNARAYLAEQHVDLPVVEDPQRKIFDAYSITPIPVTLILKADRTVSYVSIGETSYEELQAALATALLSPERSAAPAP